MDVGGCGGSNSFASDLIYGFITPGYTEKAVR